MKPRVALIGTGGTIASLGAGPFDITDYIRHGRMLDAAGLLDFWPQVAEVADVVPVKFSAVPSTAIGPAEWLVLHAACEAAAAADPALAGIVVAHGTASLEETAYFLALTWKREMPIVVVGSQRPSSSLSSDAGMNLANACRVAGDPRARGLGALVLLNDEIHAARDVTKTSTSRLQTFRSADFGCLGHADGDVIAWYRRPLRGTGAATPFDVAGCTALPRVDIAACYAGADGAAIEAFVAAGAAGIVTAGFAPGFVTPAMGVAMEAAVAKGVAVVCSTRAGSGRVFPSERMARAGFLPADNLTPQKARVLLMLALTVTRERAAIAEMFARF
jgi:L-asparaginase